MSINYQILGKAGRDNSLFLRIDSGNKLYRVLIDCGENTVSNLPQPEVKSIDILLLSHLHLDHISGFDYFFRRTFDRKTDPVNIFGPADTSSILHNRFRGFKWNLTEGLVGGYYVNDFLEDQLKTYRYDAGSGFSEKVLVNSVEHSNDVLKNIHFRISAAHLNHRISSLGYNLKEADSININKEELLRLNLESGPWLNKLKDVSYSDDEKLIVDEKSFILGTLREKLINISSGTGITYLTDFIFDTSSRSAAVKLAKDSDVLFCESQYMSEDEILAEQNFHLTSAQAATIALESNVKKLILFHVSERYIHNEDRMKEMLLEARRIFPETYFPDHWNFHDPR